MNESKKQYIDDIIKNMKQKEENTIKTEELYLKKQAETQNWQYKLF